MAENIEPSPAKRPRKPNFTPAECAVIFEEAEENLSIIKSKFSSTLSNKNKSRVWEEITSKVNSLGVCKRQQKKCCGGERKEEGYGQLSQERTPQMHCLTTQDRGRKKTRLPKRNNSEDNPVV